MSNIKYVLIRNEPLLDSKRCMARILSAGAADLDAVIDVMVDRGSSLLRSEILAVLDEYHHAVEKLLLDGKRVLTPLANYRVGIRGVFENEDDTFDPARHQLLARANAGPQLQQAIRLQAQATKTESLALPPNPVRYFDVTTGQENAVVTPGHTARLHGHRLHVDPADPSQGVYFVDAAGTATRVEEITWNMPGRLMFVNPALPAGVYRLEVRTLKQSSDETRDGVLPDKLTVS